MTLRFLTAGESHGPGLTAIVEGLPAGLALSETDISVDLHRRQRGYGRGGRQKIETDRAQITAGVSAGLTIGSPLALWIENRDWPNWHGHSVPAWRVPRPGHADLAGGHKYRLDDMRLIAERASARETAARVAISAVCRRLLVECGISIGSYVLELGSIVARAPDLAPAELWTLADSSDVRCPDPDAAEAMRGAIDAAREAGDSLGGIFVVGATGMPPGLGSHVHWDRRLDGRIAQAIMSIPAIKGVEIGPAFANARRRGTAVHDAIVPVEDAAGNWSGRVARPTNLAGGLEGGMTTGEPIVIRAAMKPIPTTVSPQSSVNLSTGRTASTEYQRSDVCAVPAASIVAEAMLAWTLAEALLEKVGGDSMVEVRYNLEGYRRHRETRYCDESD